MTLTDELQARFLWELEVTFEHLIDIIMYAEHMSEWTCGRKWDLLAEAEDDSDD